MLFWISHRTQLNYSDPVSESVMEIRVTPRTDERQVLRRFALAVTPRSETCQYTDWLGNSVHQYSVLRNSEKVVVLATAVVETRAAKQLPTGLEIPLERASRDHRSWDFLQPLGTSEDDVLLAAMERSIGLTNARGVKEAIDIATTRVRGLLAYRPGVTRSSSTLSEVLQIGAGVCQDYAHLSLALLRHVGVPCRYVSGYLYRPGVPEMQTHAWVEAFVPGIGWFAFDPTRAQVANEAYVTVAVGRSYADVPPNRGIYRGSAKETIQVSVVMKPLDAQARLTPYSDISEQPLQHESASPTPRNRSTETLSSGYSAVWVEQQQLQ